MSNGTSAHQALERLLQAERTAKTQRRQAEEEADEKINEAQAEAASLIEEARAEAEEEAQEIIEQASAENGAGSGPAPAQKKENRPGHLPNIDEMRRRAAENLDDAVELLVAWVTGKEI